MNNSASSFHPRIARVCFHRSASYLASTCGEEPRARLVEVADHRRTGDLVPGFDQQQLVRAQQLLAPAASSSDDLVEQGRPTPEQVLEHRGEDLVLVPERPVDERPRDVGRLAMSSSDVLA
jgi:hypothetical protein